MVLVFKFNTEFEAERVSETIKRMEWFLANGYKPRLPAGIGAENPTKEQIAEAVGKEFAEKEYSNAAEQISKDFASFENEFLRILEKITKIKMPEEFEVFLTKYGVGGSYFLPNKVILNFANYKPEQRAKTIAHEIVHLAIEEQIRKYKIPHWQKERIVDLILTNERLKCLNYDFWQKDYHGFEKPTDNFFKELFFKSPELFFQKISQANQANSTGKTG
ncbi:MAG: hypothetical protein J4478_01945 [Candidatus Diapherotrites archaeon]|uniref:Uncharacterized protein n=1 Tax=Candidatus Iainarchaeum sp. TaxID=3101447 RepID=A0A8T4KZL6_9ARCH|nr:hypothetical protein [Candidatus Diapherotrites archaeon]